MHCEDLVVHSFHITVIVDKAATFSKLSKKFCMCIHCTCSCCFVGQSQSPAHPYMYMYVCKLYIQFVTASVYSLLHVLFHVL